MDLPDFSDPSLETCQERTFLEPQLGGTSGRGMLTTRWPAAHQGLSLWRMYRA
jgi:hypothetical protein